MTFRHAGTKKNVYPNIIKNSMDTHILQYFLKYCQSLNTKHDGNASYLMCIQISRIRSQNVWCHFYCRILDGSLFMCNRRFSIFRTWWTQHGWRWQKCIFVKSKGKNQYHLTGVIYRPPNRNMVEINNSMNCILEQSLDFNQDFLKHEKHPSISNALI